MTKASVERRNAMLMLLAYVAFWIMSKSSQLLDPGHRAPNWIREGVYWESLVNPAMRETYTDIYAQFLPPAYQWISTVIVNAFGTDALNVFWMSLNTLGSACLLVLCGGRLGTYAGGFVAAFLFLRSFDATQMTMGATAHGASYLIVLAWMYLALRRNYVLLPLVPAAGLLLYQPVGFQVGVLTFGLFLLNWRAVWTAVATSPRGVIAAVVVVCSVSIGVTAVDYMSNPLVHGAAETREQYVEYVKTGSLAKRLWLHVSTSVDAFDIRGISDSRAIAGTQVTVRKAILIVALVIAVVATRARGVAFFGYVFVTSAALYLVADVLFPLLYQPSRMLRATMPMLTVLFIGTQLTMAAAALLRHWPQRDVLAGATAFAFTAGLFGLGQHPHLKLIHPASRTCDLARLLPPEATLAIDTSYYLKYVHVCAGRRTLYLPDVHDDPVVFNLPEFERRKAVYQTLLHDAKSLHQLEQAGRPAGATHVIVGFDAQGDSLDTYPVKKALVDEASQAGRLVGCVPGESYVIDVRERSGPVLPKPFDCGSTENRAVAPTN